jgi:hypothetical protein
LELAALLKVIMGRHYRHCLGTKLGGYLHTSAAKGGSICRGRLYKEYHAMSICHIPCSAVFVMLCLCDAALQDHSPILTMHIKLGWLVFKVQGLRGKLMKQSMCDWPVLVCH